MRNRPEIKFNRDPKQRSDEHDRLSEKGWSTYKASTSTFLSDCQPQFKKTSNELSSPPNKFVSVYFVRFQSKENPSYSFLKIGISNKRGIRFDFDSHRFNVEFLATMDRFSRKEALKIESGLHSKFAEFKTIPRMKLLSGGNSECFIDDPGLKTEVLKAFGVSEKQFMPSEKITPSIAALLRLVNFGSIKSCNTIEYNTLELKRIVAIFRGSLKRLGVQNLPSKTDLMNYYHFDIKKNR